MRKPELPPETCYKIDEMITYCKQARQVISVIVGLLDELDSRFIQITDDVEELRKANSGLREYGVYYKEKLNEVLKERGE
jgi:hypothetical protein